jgi:GcrA cell cycle regulator
MGRASDKIGGVWTDPCIEALKTLWADGLSCSRIAAKLGNGITRNAVIGKVTRLGLPPRLTTTSRARSVYVYKPAAPRTVPVDPSVPEPEYLCPPGTFPDGPACRYPKGDTNTPNWQMCGQPVEQYGSPYCNFHRARCYDTTRTATANKKGEQRSRGFDFRRAG